MDLLHDLGSFASNNLSLVCIFVIGVFILWNGVAPFFLFKRLGIPGPTPLPFIGNLLEVVKKEEFLLHEGYVNKYGPVCGFYLGMQPQMLISDPTLIKEILIKNFNKFVNRPIPEGNVVVGGRHGLLQARDDNWRRLRTTISPIFSAAKIKQVIPLINTSCATLAKIFGETAQSGKSIDVFRTYGRFTMEVIMSTAFGLESNTQTDPNDTFTSNAQNIFQMNPRAALNLCFPFLVPVTNLWKYFGGGNITKAGKSIALLQETAQYMVKQRKEAGHSVRKDLLELMLSAEMKDDQGNKVSKLSDDEIIAQCLTFILAGYETTSNALAYTSYLLALNPDKQDRLREEVDSVDDNKGGIDYDTIQVMEYMDMVISESLRLFPPAHRYGRMCNEACTIEGVNFEKGMFILFPVYALHRNPEYWPDPLKFEPERFTAEAKQDRHPFAYAPFGGGPRVCIGMRFALVEAKMALFHILREYKLEQCPETEVPLDIKAGPTMSPRNGIFLRISKR